MGLWLWKSSSWKGNWNNTDWDPSEREDQDPRAENKDPEHAHIWRTEKQEPRGSALSLWSGIYLIMLFNILRWIYFLILRNFIKDLKCAFISLIKLFDLLRYKIFKIMWCYLKVADCFSLKIWWAETESSIMM